MHTRSSHLVGKLLLVTLALCATPGSFAQAPQDPGWPRRLAKNATELTYYQPQVDEWKDYKELSARMAVSVKPKDSDAAVGVVYLRLRTESDLERHLVTLSNLEISKTSFPSLPQPAAASMDQIVRSFLPPTFATTISLDRLVASVDKAKVPPRTVDIKNDPPQIFVSERPAILLQLDGQPIRAEIKDSDLEYVVNANWPIFAEKKKSQFFLLVANHWLTAKELNGPWSVPEKLPKDMKKIGKDPKFKDLARNLPLNPTPGTAQLPQVFTSETPAEIILFDGAPVYEKIPTTDLVYATNTDSEIFVYSPSKTYYYLTAGRWFSAPGMNGPWTFATPKLPADFARIPRSSPRAYILMSVPGTPEAADAVLMAQVPTKITLDPVKAAAKVNVSYAGEPQFKPIEGTSLSYAANTAEKVIKVGDVYYVCFQGAWFKSTSAQGPWQAAESVPKEIYSIPPSSPVYNVTYVTQTTTSDGDIECSHTAGYLGMFVTGMAVGAVIGWGTGYYYPPYYYGGYGYYGYPRTYGVGYYGAYGGGYGVYGPYRGATYGARYNPATGTYGRGATAYGPYGSRSAGAAYNPYTGSYARGASASTAYGSRGVAGSYNPSTGTARATRQSSSPYAQWGSSAVSRGGEAAVGRHYSNASGTVGSVRTTGGGEAIGASGARGSGAVGRTGSGDLYAGRDGNVYRNSSGSWQQYNNGGWQNIDAGSTAAGQRAQSIQQQRASGSSARPDTSSYSRPSSSQMQSLQRDSSDRSRGATQSQRFNSSSRSSSGFGGGRRGGGGRRR